MCSENLMGALKVNDLGVDIFIKGGKNPYKKMEVLLLL